MKIKYILLDLKLIYSAIVLVLLLSSCTSKEKKISKFIAKYDVSKSLNGNFIIMPFSGCRGCISATEDLIIKYGKEYKINTIVVDYNNKKEVRLRFNKYQDINFTLDSLNLWRSYFPNSTIYPRLIIFNNDNLVFDKYVNPENKTAISDFVEILSIYKESIICWVWIPYFL